MARRHRREAGRAGLGWLGLLVLLGCGADRGVGAPEVGSMPDPDGAVADAVSGADVFELDGEPRDAEVAADHSPRDVHGADVLEPADGGSPDLGAESCAVAGLVADCLDILACPAPLAPYRGLCEGPARNVCCAPAPDCSVSGAPGRCVDVAACPGASTPGLCPGPAEIQCCTDPAQACDQSTEPAPRPSGPEVVHDARCPAGMVWAGDFCIDRFEASLVQLDGAPWSPFRNPGPALVRAVSVAYAVPQGYISGAQAQSACQAAGKRLCTDAEWLAACQGPGQRSYPYGDTREDGVCNDARARHPAVEYFGTNDPTVFGMLDHPCLNQLAEGLALTGQHLGCESELGAFDMMGNLHEWTADAAGTFRGGFYVDTRINGEGCLYRTTAHGFTYWDYSTGFRCCAAPL